MPPSSRPFGSLARSSDDVVAGRRLRLTVAAALVAAALPFAAGAAEAAPSCEWMAGDLHVHTTHSHDSWGGPEDDNTGPDEFYTFGWGVGDEGRLAASRGLDYVAITDHNDIRSQAEFGDISQYGVIPIPSYENSLAGHVQMHGATKLYDNGARTLADVERIADELRANGGVFQVNHPADGEWVEAYGYGFVPDAIEVWNIGVWAYEPPMPATNDHEYPLRFYDDFLKMGHQIAATGGSDSHWRSTTAAQGVGQPTTWICAETSDVPGLLDGIEAGRTTISHQPPAYSRTFAELSADGNGDGNFEAMLGDTVPRGSAIQATVTEAPGATLRLVTDKGSQEVTVDAYEFSHVFSVPADALFARAEVFYEDGREQRSEQQAVCDALEGFLQLFGDDNPLDDRVAYCQARLAVVALTSPIYFAAPDAPDRSTTLLYDGDMMGRAGDTATFAATLLAGDGPVAGAPIEFAYRGEVYRATTDAHGRATTTVRLQGPPGTYEIASSFAGDASHDPSTDSDPFEVTTGRP